MRTQSDGYESKATAQAAVCCAAVQEPSVGRAAHPSGWTRTEPLRLYQHGQLVCYIWLRYPRMFVARAGAGSDQIIDWDGVSGQGKVGAPHKPLAILFLSFLTPVASAPKVISQPTMNCGELAQCGCSLVLSGKCADDRAGGRRACAGGRRACAGGRVSARE
jgi:hypothetical protein